MPTTRRRGSGNILAAPQAPQQPIPQQQQQQQQPNLLGMMGRGLPQRPVMGLPQTQMQPQAQGLPGYGGVLASILGGGVGQFQPQQPQRLNTANAPQGVVGNSHLTNPSLQGTPAGSYRGGQWATPTFTPAQAAPVFQTPFQGPAAVAAAARGINMNPGQRTVPGQSGALGGFLGAQNAALADNQKRYDEGLGLIRQGKEDILGDLGDTYSSLLDSNDAMGADMQERLKLGGQQLRNDQQAGFTAAGKNAKSRGSELTGYTDAGYASLGQQASNSGNRQMDFLNQQQQGMVDLLNSQSNAEYEREARRHQNASSENTQNLISSGLLNTSTRTATQRGLDDDTALREMEIGDRRLNKAMGVADSYTGRGLGVMGDADRASLNVGQNAINAGLGVRSDLNRDLGNIEMQGLTADSNLANDIFGMGNQALQQQQTRDLQLSGQYGAARTDIQGNMLGRETDWIYNREDAYPDMNQLLGLLQQPGALGQGLNSGGGGGGGGPLYSGGRMASGGGTIRMGSASGGVTGRQGTGGVDGLGMLPPTSMENGIYSAGSQQQMQPQQQQGNPFAGQQQATGRYGGNIGNTGGVVRQNRTNGPTTRPIGQQAGYGGGSGQIYYSPQQGAPMQQYQPTPQRQWPYGQNDPQIWYDGIPQMPGYPRGSW
jgi:hypothetical protein